MITIEEDRFHFDPATRLMILDEPATLFGDRIARTDIHEFRIKQGWQLMTTMYDEDELSVMDLWSYTGLPATPA